MNESLRIPSDAAELDDAYRLIAAIHDDLADALSREPNFLQFRVKEIAKEIRSYLRENGIGGMGEN